MNVNEPNKIQVVRSMVYSIKQNEPHEGGWNVECEIN